MGTLKSRALGDVLEVFLVIALSFCVFVLVLVLVILVFVFISVLVVSASLVGDRCDLNQSQRPFQRDSRALRHIQERVTHRCLSAIVRIPLHLGQTSALRLWYVSKVCKLSPCQYR